MVARREAGGCAGRARNRGGATRDDATDARGRTRQSMKRSGGRRRGTAIANRTRPRGERCGPTRRGLARAPETPHPVPPRARARRAPGRHAERRASGRPVRIRRSIRRASSDDARRLSRLIAPQPSAAPDPCASARGRPTPPSPRSFRARNGVATLARGALQRSQVRSCVTGVPRIGGGKGRGGGGRRRRERAGGERGGEGRREG